MRKFGFVKHPTFIIGLLTFCWVIFFSTIIAFLIQNVRAEELNCEISSIPGKPSFSTQINICRSGYELSYNPGTKTANWVMEHIKSENVQGETERTDKFVQDPAINDNLEATLSDYKGSGYARGHLAAAGNFRKNEKEMKESFYLSNIVPQVQNCNNSGIWSNLEKTVRQWSITYGEVYTVTGPIYAGEPKYIGNGVRVPDALFKTVWVPARSQTISFVIPNESLCRMEAEDFIVTQVELEKELGYLVFPNIIVGSATRMF